MMNKPIEKRFFVNGYQLAAKEWNPQASIKVIALHGWLDNAASFDDLAQLLPACHIIALDMPGHGFSDHKQEQATYNIWDDLRDILAVADVMGWEQFHLLSHSRGAIMSVLLAAAMPERISSMFLLDAIFPPPFDINKSHVMLGEFLKGYGSVTKKNRPHYAAIDDAVAARCKVTQMSEPAARKIVERGLQKDKDGYAWVTDSRLMISSAFKLSDTHIDVMVNSVKCPCTVLFANDGFVVKSGIKRLKAYPHINYQAIEGKHHFHMEEQAPEIADLIRCFYSELP